MNEESNDLIRLSKYSTADLVRHFGHRLDRNRLNKHSANKAVLLHLSLWDLDERLLAGLILARALPLRVRNISHGSNRRSLQRTQRASTNAPIFVKGSHLCTIAIVRKSRLRASNQSRRKGEDIWKSLAVTMQKIRSVDRIRTLHEFS